VKKLWVSGMAADWEGFSERAAWPGRDGLVEPPPERRLAHAAAFGLLLRHPAARLDVKLLIETGDDATAFALRRQLWPAGTEMLVVPPGPPRTKPRALNYGLARARGEFVVVYDTEDRPHPDQLTASVRAFQAAGGGLACVQARLVGRGRTRLDRGAVGT